MMLYHINFCHERGKEVSEFVWNICRKAIQSSEISSEHVGDG